MALRQLSASGTKQWMHCHATADLAAAIPGFDIPVPETAATSKGHDIHKILEKAGGLPRPDLRHVIASLLYVEQLRSARNYKVLTEESIVVEWMRTKPRTTVDLVLYLSDEIHVLDYKTGKIPVDPVSNPQLMYYAVSYRHLAPKARGVMIHIIQPWAGVMEAVWYSNETLDAFMAEVLRHEQEILAGDRSFSPSEGACQFCPANPHTRGAKGKPSCPVMLQILYPSKLQPITQGDLDGFDTIPVG